MELLSKLGVEVAEATARDLPLEGTVLSSERGEIRVDVEGVIGLLLEWEAGATPRPGDKLRVRVIMLNVKRQRLELMLARD